MSFELCKKIKLDRKNNKIECFIASNNVTPKKYQFCEICNSEYKDYKNYSFEDKIIYLFYLMETGSIQINSINENTVKFEYAMAKVKEYLHSKNIDSYNDLYKKICGNFSLKSLWDIYGEVFKIWNSSLVENINGDYRILLDNRFYVTNTSKYNGCYSKFDYCDINYSKFKKFGYKQAYIFKSQMGEKLNLKIEKIHSN